METPTSQERAKTHEQQPAAEVITLWSVVEVQYNKPEHKCRFLVVNENRDLPDGMEEDTLPDDVVPMPVTTPLMKKILHKEVGYADDHFPEPGKGIEIIGVDNSLAVVEQPSQGA